MSSHPSDPNEEAHELFPADTWDDTPGVVRSPDGTASILPSRKLSPEPASPKPSARQEDQGLRIAPSTMARQSHDDTPPIDVHEIDGRVVRLEPEEPSQPKMPRQVTFHEQTPRPPREVESPVWGKAKKFSLKWMLGIATGVSMLVVIPISLLGFINRPNEAGSRSKPSLVLVDTGEDPDTSLIDELTNRQEEAMRVFVHFKTASTEEALLPMVRDRETVEPLIRASRRSVVVSRTWDPNVGSTWEVHETKTRPFGLMRGTLPDFSDFAAYFVISDQQLLLDWKATTGYGTATFDELADGFGDPSEIRGLISQASYYSPAFPESAFRNFLLVGPDGLKSIWCYTLRGTPVNEALRTLCRGGGILEPIKKPQKVSLRLERPADGALPNQWIIAELLHEEWIDP